MQVRSGQIAANRCSSVGPLSQITTRGPGWFALSCCKKAVEVSALLFPAISNLPSLQTNSRVVAGLLSPPGTGGVHQRCLSLEYPFASQVGIGSKVGFIHEEPPLSWASSRIWRTGGRRLSVLHPWLRRRFLRSPTDGGSSSNCSLSPTALLEKLPYYFPVPVGFNPLFWVYPPSAQRPNLGPRLGESCPAI